MLTHDLDCAIAQCRFSSVTAAQLRRKILNSSDLRPPRNKLMLAHDLETSLLGLVARLDQALQGLLARRVLLAADNASLLGLHQVLLLQPTAGVLGRAVVDLGLGAHRGDLAAAGHVVAARATTHGRIAAVAVATVVGVAVAVAVATVVAAVVHSTYGPDFLPLSAKLSYIESLGTPPP